MKEEDVNTTIRSIHETMYTINHMT